MANILIAFFSRNGQNYVSGSIENLKVGNTEVVANKIQKATGGDLFKIDTIETYPITYTETTNIAQDELRKKARPKLATSLNTMAEYDTVIVGYPNWWNTMPMAVYTFLESYDFTGKTILPYCTHEGSGMGSTQSDIAKVCPTAIVKEGLAIHGGSSSSADILIKKWLKHIC